VGNNQSTIVAHAGDNMLDHQIRLVNLVVFVVIAVAIAVNAFNKMAAGKFNGVHQYALVFFGVFTLFLIFVTLLRMFRKK